MLPLLLLTASSLQSQNPPPDAASFHSRSELVLVPAVVTDKSGKHVPNLSKKDFIVTEDGKPQTVAVFEEVNTSATRVQRAATAPGEFSNVLQTGNNARRLVIVCLDMLNTPMLQQGGMRKELLKYLAQALDPGEPTELVLIDNSGLRVVHDFTSDPAVLAEALQRLTGISMSRAEKQPVSDAPHSGDALAALLRMLATMENEQKAHMEAFDRRAAVLATMQAMQQIAASVAGIPGRKALLWVGAGFPFSIGQGDSSPDRGSVMDLYEHTWRLLNQAQLAVYPIDVRQLTNFKFHGADEPGTKHMPWETTGDDPYTDILLRDDKEQQEILTTLRNFADATGGRAFFDSNDLQRGFREAVNDNASYYMLGYYLNRQGKKPGWHRLQVRLERGGMEVRARNAFLLTKAGESRGSGTDLATALHSPMDFTGIPIQGRWTTVTPAAGNMRNVAFELVMPAGFAEIDGSDNNHLQVEFLAEASRDGDPAPVRAGRTLNSHLSAESLEQIRSQGMTYRSQLKLAPGEYSVRFVVLDTLSGRMGSVSSALKVASY